MNNLKVQKITRHAFLPTRISPGSAGLDIKSPINCIIPKKDKVRIKTDLKFEFPEGCYGQLFSKSGLAWNHSIITLAGTIDADFRGNVEVILYNLSNENVFVNRGDKICQLVILKTTFAEVIETEIQSDTERGEKGLGEMDKVQIL